MTTFRRVRLNSDFGALVFSTQEPYEAVENILNDLTGWYGGVGVSDGGPERALGHGSFVRRRRRTDRAITIEGTIIVRNQADRALIERLISGTAWEGEEWVLQVEEEGSPTLQTRVQLSGEIGRKELGTHAMAVQIPLSAGDPFLYTAPEEITLYTPGTGIGLDWHGDIGIFTADGVQWGGALPPARAYNSGNADAWPEYLVRGTFPSGFRVTLDGRSVVYAEPVTPRTPVQILTASGEAKVNGDDVTYRLSHAEWAPIRANSPAQPKLEPLDNASEGWAEFTWHNTYI